MGTNGEKSPALPSSISRRYVRSVVGFGVAVGIGLAPFLGKVIGIDAMLNLFPLSSRTTLILFSSFLMGSIAAVVQFYARESLTRPAIRKLFGATCALLLVSFSLLFVFYSRFVESVPIDRGKATVAVILGDKRIEGKTCRCPPHYDTLRCLKSLGVGNEAEIETCWDRGSIRDRRLLLHSSYLALMGLFGALIGVLLLQEDAVQKRKRRPRKTTAPSRKPEPDQGTS